MRHSGYRLRWRLAAGSLAILAPWVGQVSAYDGQLTPPAQCDMSAERLERIEPALQRMVDDKQVAGAVVMIARYGQLVFCRPVGFRDVATGEPMQRDTIFRIYSMSKPVTCAAALALCDDGKLALDDPVAKYLPQLAELRVQDEDTVAPPITVRDLMQHTAGFRYGIYGDAPLDEQYRQRKILDNDRPLDVMIGKLSQLPLHSVPGSKWNYSVSTDVLGRVIERASGQQLDAFLAERIFKPLQMQDTGFYVPPDKLHRFASNHGPDEERGLKVIDAAQQSPFRAPRALLSGGGGLVSTADDYMRFCLMLAGDGSLNEQRILQADTVRQMRTNQLPPSLLPLKLGKQILPGLGYGLGVSVVVHKTPWAPHVPLGEYGWAGAASTHFWISPQHDCVGMVLAQHMPFTMRLESTVKRHMYAAVQSPPPQN